jgi:hypothetical protein
MITRRALPALLGAIVYAQFEAPKEAEVYVRVTTWISAEKYQNHRIRRLEHLVGNPGHYGPDQPRRIENGEESTAALHEEG